MTMLPDISVLTQKNTYKTSNVDTQELNNNGRISKGKL